ncbi:hypothetical protein Tco_0237858 [Tanacetum coccineum]
MVYFVDGARAVGVETSLMMDFVRIALLKLKIHSLMIQTRILSKVLQIFPLPLQTKVRDNIRCELCGNDSHYGYDCPSRVPLRSSKKREQAYARKKEKYSCCCPYHAFYYLLMTRISRLSSDHLEETREKWSTIITANYSLPEEEVRIDFSQNVKDGDSFTFVIRTFLPFLIYPEVSPLSCSTRSEDTIFDPGIFT